VIFTGSLRTEHTPVFRLLGDFETARWGDTLHQWGGGEIWRGGVDLR